MDQNTYICYGKLVDTKKNIKRGAFFDSCRRYLRFKSALHLIPLSIQLCIFLFIKFVLRQSACRVLH